MTKNIYLFEIHIKIFALHKNTGYVNSRCFYVSGSAPRTAVARFAVRTAGPRSGRDREAGTMLRKQHRAEGPEYRGSDINGYADIFAKNVRVNGDITISGNKIKILSYNIYVNLIP